MDKYKATVQWERGDQVFTDDEYSRGHTWEFDGGLVVPASASPGIVPLPHSIAENVDPEEAFVAALSSCHMLFFLAMAAGKGFVVDNYRDSAAGYLAKDECDRMAITKVVLRPDATYSGEKRPTREQVEKLHERAHKLCFIANSVRSDVVTDVIG